MGPFIVGMKLNFAYIDTTSERNFHAKYYAGIANVTCRGASERRSCSQGQYCRASAVLDIGLEYMLGWGIQVGALFIVKSKE